MICMKKVRFSSRPRAKVGAWGQQAQLKHRAVSSFKNNRGLVALLLQIIYCKWCLQQSLYLIPPCLYLQGVPKVRSANLTHYNFWSKLYFYMKFLEDVYFSLKYMYSEFQWLACPFCFLSHSVAVAAWGGIQRLDPFWAFLSPGAQDPVQPPNNICLV